jgi:hypothetical protein
MTPKLAAAAAVLFATGACLTGKVIAAGTSNSVSLPVSLPVSSNGYPGLAKARFHGLTGIG